MISLGGPSYLTMSGGGRHYPVLGYFSTFSWLRCSPLPPQTGFIHPGRSLGRYIQPTPYPTPLEERGAGDIRVLLRSASPFLFPSLCLQGLGTRLGTAPGTGELGLGPEGVKEGGRKGRREGVAGGWLSQEMSSHPARAGLARGQAGFLAPGPPLSLLQRASRGGGR